MALWASLVPEVGIEPALSFVGNKGAANPVIIGPVAVLGFLDIGGSDEGQTIYRRTDNSDIAGSGSFRVGRMPQAQLLGPIVLPLEIEVGGMEVSEAKRLREFERENVELKKIVAEQTLNIRMLKDVNSRKWCACQSGDVVSAQQAYGHVFANSTCSSIYPFPAQP